MNGPLPAGRTTNDRVPAAASAQAFVTEVGKLITTNYFQFFVEKLAASFAPRFYNNIFRCKRFNDTGAQQLLLDTHALKTLLLELPALGQARTRHAPGSSPSALAAEMHQGGHAAPHA